MQSFNWLRWEIRSREFYGPERIDFSPCFQYLWQYKSYLIFANSADFLIDDQRCSFDPAMTNLIWKILFFVNSLSLKFYSFVISLSSILLFLDLSHQKLPSPLSFSFILDESHFSKNKRILNRSSFLSNTSYPCIFPCIRVNRPIVRRIGRGGGGRRLR